jgi:hypothetical protein
MNKFIMEENTLLEGLEKIKKLLWFAMVNKYFY